MTDSLFWPKFIMIVGFVISGPVLLFIYRFCGPPGTGRFTYPEDTDRDARYLARWRTEVADDRL